MQRRSEPPDSLDDFPTHPWATRALCEMLTERGIGLSESVAWDPACNRGFMARPLGEYFKATIASDIFDYGFEAMDFQGDFTLNGAPKHVLEGVDWIVTNPPFRLGKEFILTALGIAKRGVAVFVRIAFDEGIERYSDLFERFPETYAFPFVERVPLHRGKLRHPYKKYWDPSAKDEAGDWRIPSTATAYGWLVWDKMSGSDAPTQKFRIAPCRDRLIREGDYPIRYDDEQGIFDPGGAMPLFDAVELVQGEIAV